MNQAKLTIQWNKTAKQVLLIPENMNETEVLALLKCSMDIAANQVLEQSSKQSGIVIPQAVLPNLKGD